MLFLLKIRQRLHGKKWNGRWINQSNEVEAIEVVKILKDLLIKQPGKSVGIITFNAKQQTKSGCDR